MMTATGEATLWRGAPFFHTLKGPCVQMIAEENVYQLA